MLTKYVAAGDKIEIRSIERKNDIEIEPKVYHSRVNDTISDDQIEVTMPIEKNKLVLLSIGMEYQVIFFTKSGLYQCQIRIIDRYKTDNIYLLLCDVITGIQKHQRREYYRYQCSIEMTTRLIFPQELSAIRQKQPLPEYEYKETDYKKAVIADISGGGIRFVSEEQYEEKSIVWSHFTLESFAKGKEYNLFGIILRKTQLEHRHGFFEYRLQFAGIKNETREEIIKYIFEEERKHRKKD